MASIVGLLLEKRRQKLCRMRVFGTGLSPKSRGVRGRYPHTHSLHLLRSLFVVHWQNINQLIDSKDCDAQRNKKRTRARPKAGKNNERERPQNPNMTFTNMARPAHTSSLGMVTVSVISTTSVRVRVLVRVLLAATFSMSVKPGFAGLPKKGLLTWTASLTQQTWCVGTGTFGYNWTNQSTLCYHPP